MKTTLMIFTLLTGAISGNSQDDFTLHKHTHIRIHNGSEAVIRSGTLLQILSLDMDINIYDYKIAEADSFIPDETLVVVVNDILPNQIGVVLFPSLKGSYPNVMEYSRLSIVTGVNTSEYKAGDELYISSDATGGLTTLNPSEEKQPELTKRDIFGFSLVLSMIFALIGVLISQWMDKFYI